MNFKERVAINIKRYRLDAGLTLKDVAEKCGMSEANLQKYEAGNMKSLDIDTTHKIATALGTTAEDLTGWKGMSAEVVPIEEELLEHYRKLNAEGREKATAYIADLAGNEKYRVKKRR